MKSDFRNYMITRVEDIFYLQGATSIIETYKPFVFYPIVSVYLRCGGKIESRLAIVQSVDFIKSHRLIYIFKLFLFILNNAWKSTVDSFWGGALLQKLFGFCQLGILTGGHQMRLLVWQSIQLIFHGSPSWRTLWFYYLQVLAAIDSSRCSDGRPDIHFWGRIIYHI